MHRYSKFDFNHVYDLDKLRQYADYATRDIQRTLELIEEIKAYRNAMHEHAQKVALAEMEYVIILQRRTDYYNKVKYDVMAYHRPKGIEVVDGTKVSGKYYDSKVFDGKERHEAIKYATALSKEYNCEVEKKGFPRR